MRMHPTPTARHGHLRSDDVVTRGVNADTGPYRATMDVYCSQCGFVCNLDRDIRNVDEFAGEEITIANGLQNGSFEHWTGSTPDNWTVNGSVAQVSTPGYFDHSDFGTSSIQLIQTGIITAGDLLLGTGRFVLLHTGGHIQLGQSGVRNVSIGQQISNPSAFNGQNLTFRARVKSLTNDVVKLRVLMNDVSYYSSYNIAQQAFQEMHVQVKCPGVVSVLAVYIMADNAIGTAYVDQAYLARNGNSTTSDVTAGCPSCGSFFYA